jgi:glycosyltransferase involved in cell wall biosynthesis
MRILRFMGYPINNFSTLERMMLEQAQSLRAKGHQLDIAYDGIRRPEAAAAARAHAPEIGLHFDLPSSIGLRQPGAGLRYARAASKLISQGKYDIVHVYFSPGATLLNQLARLHPRTRFLRTIGSTPLPTGQYRFLDQLKRRKWLFDTAQMRKLICVGNHIGDMLADYGVERSRLVVVPNATDVDKFSRRVPHARSAKLRLAFIGRMNPVKNIPLMIEGMRLLVEQGERDISLTLVGAGELRESLIAQVAQHGLEPYVTFAGHIDDIPGMLNREVDIYVQASHNEGCPASVIEAMACEVPVLLSDIPGHLQVATPDRHATYFRAGDAQGFASAVQRMKADYPRYRDMAINSRQHIVDTYSIDAWIGKELDVYSGLMQE